MVPALRFIFSFFKGKKEKYITAIRAKSSHFTLLPSLAIVSKVLK